MQHSSKEAEVGKSKRSRGKVNPFEAYDIPISITVIDAPPLAVALKSGRKTTKRLVRARSGPRPSKVKARVEVVFSDSKVHNLDKTITYVLHAYTSLLGVLVPDDTLLPGPQNPPKVISAGSDDDHIDVGIKQAGLQSGTTYIITVDVTVTASTAEDTFTGSGSTFLQFIK
jgi:hypothetical protein